MSLEHCRVVLIETHYPGNLGATARIMRNFGLRDLVLVSPIANRNDRGARQMSTHGEAILNDARIVSDLSDAISDCVLVVGTSGKSGGLYRQQNVGAPDEIARHVVEAVSQASKAAILYGPEPNGLTNEIVTRCHYLMQIPTADEYASLNLAQAVAICLYEVQRAWLAITRLQGPPPHPRPLSPGGERGERAHPHRELFAASGAEEGKTLASVAMQEHMFQQLQTALAEIHFVYGDKAEPLMHAVRHLLGKAWLTEMEVKVLLGLARQIRWYVANHRKTIDEA